MAYKPILYNTLMVQAIHKGIKTQTRRMVKSRHESGLYQVCRDNQGVIKSIESLDFNEHNCEKDIIPKYDIGDICWIRETWQTTYNGNFNQWDPIYRASCGTWYDDDGLIKWKPSIHMPKKYARLFQKVTNYRVELLHNISESDARAEGVLHLPGTLLHYNYIDNRYTCATARESFQTLFISIYGQDVWDANPYVFVYGLKLVPKPNDFI